MKAKTLGILAAITIAGIVLAIFLNQKPASQFPQSGELLFPELLPVVNDVNEIVVETKDQTVTLVRGENIWRVKEKAGYRADVEKVKQTLIGLAELRILEPKTKNPELYDRLGLRDKEEEGSLSTTVTLKTPNNPEAALVILGNQRPAKGNPRMSEIYARKPGDPQTWLTIGNLPLEKVGGEWLDKEITALTTKRVHRVTVMHPGGDTLFVSKDTPEDLDFQLDSIPSGSKVASQFNVNNVVGTLVQLSLENVKEAHEVNFQDRSGVTAVLETFDGLRLHVQTAKQEDKVFGKFSAEYDQKLVQHVNATTSTENGETVPAQDFAQDEKAPESPETKKTADIQVEPSSKEDSLLKKPEEVQREVEAFNQRVGGWAYELPTFRVENFSKAKKDLLETIP
ncbi:DUF4340 domain-containing protein [Candidatus Nitrospira neomarina]|uniref:DUF4340 domain-containing protein n=1 Tax=Candidatus Nitrospira neomarina TaxID=3020899 RepID=A0AA96JVJ2_9BACT|nr:DUF4340 domain-containing protein [Candidatus Nitrospira neomarina]WNM61125.1 DUF4340 domain-containing protein [Candidatus Nitrospira neomarina]